MISFKGYFGALETYCGLSIGNGHNKKGKEQNAFYAELKPVANQLPHELGGDIDKVTMLTVYHLDLISNGFTAEAVDALNAKVAKVQDWIILENEMPENVVVYIKQLPDIIEGALETGYIQRFQFVFEQERDVDRSGVITADKIDIKANENNIPIRK